MSLFDIFKRKVVYVPILVKEAPPEITYGFDLRPKELNKSILKDSEERYGDQ